MYHHPYNLQYYQHAWDVLRAQQWEKLYRSWLAEYRRLALYNLQWGTPTGPYWAPIPSVPWWINARNWNQIQYLAQGQPPNTYYGARVGYDRKYKMLPNY